MSIAPAEREGYLMIPRNPTKVAWKMWVRLAFRGAINLGAAVASFL
jgi:hypothetical protein